MKDHQGESSESHSGGATSIHPVVTQSGQAESFAEQIGVIVIGRNEGQRLYRCLRSIGRRCVVVYVDSGSTDDSLRIARSAGADIVELDPSVPFTAARARNAGARKLAELSPTCRYIQFLDGDCEMSDGWLRSASEYLKDQEDVAVVCGHLRERDPEVSVYHRLGEIEWGRTTGEIDYCGGIFLVRGDEFWRVGGFDDNIAAGEEPELCSRMRAAGGRIVRLDRPMALHDLHMFQFRQWWKRAIRGGYGAFQATVFGPKGSRQVFRRQVISGLFWAAILPIAALAVSLYLWTTGSPALGLLSLLSLPIVLTAQMLKLCVRRISASDPVADSLAFGWFTVIGKFAALIGFTQCVADHLFRRSRTRVARTFHKS